MLPMPAGCWLCLMPLTLAQHGLCTVCLRQLLALPCGCPRCGLSSSQTNIECGRCLRRPPPWQRMIAVTPWQPPLNRLVNRLKFYRATALAVMLARLLLLCWLKQRRKYVLQRPDLLLTVPLHHRRAWQRGYNQLEEIASQLARWTQCRYLPRAITRIRAAHIQHHLGALARRKNLRGAFRLEIEVRGLHITLLDDVVTTGSTVAEISRLLLAHGAASVQIWCLCRTL
ncbi:DNA utilization protein GntX [Erwinia sorbitola]|uniref:DNA utilization protein GntX n=1 Tax=Erwinia sorbitola TaxID=2681984 RepID=A0A6I6E861_9GAMM|nr:DNA utilization protein GntX [Erwinia sorbitola]MTD29129.1 DNA utilization protein GntX [Erwinia sorbitola]QGU85974.1 DNA utilization protein GntX [Erwinia sorbitola]